MNDNVVVDSAGREISIECYINNVTPQHQLENESAREVYENFGAEFVNDVDSEYALYQESSQSKQIDNHDATLQNFEGSEHSNGIPPQELIREESKSSCTFQVQPTSTQTDSCSSRRKRKASGKNSDEQECPIVGCDRKIKHYWKNKSRHIQEFHGQQLENGKWVLKRYKCRECYKCKIEKIVKRPNNLDSHYKNYHPGKKLSTLNAFIDLDGPLQYKNYMSEQIYTETEVQNLHE